MRAGRNCRYARTPRRASFGRPDRHCRRHARPSPSLAVRASRLVLHAMLSGSACPRPPAARHRMPVTPVYVIVVALPSRAWRETPVTLDMPYASYEGQKSRHARYCRTPAILAHTPAAHATLMFASEIFCPHACFHALPWQSCVLMERHTHELYIGATMNMLRPPATEMRREAAAALTSRERAVRRSFAYAFFTTMPICRVILFALPLFIY